MPAITTAFAQGLAANRPAASTANSGWFYLATDTAGGTLYQSTGSAWVQVAGAVNSGAGTFTGEVTGSDFKPTGLTGATGASRYVGATTSGAPASGTFAVGDFTIDQTAAIYVCTAAGTPGTWAQISGAGSTPTVRAYNSATLSIAQLTTTALTFNSTRFDQGTSAQHSTSSNTSRLTCQVAGVYLIGATLELVPNSTGNTRQVSLQVNGATVIASQNFPVQATGVYPQITITALYKLAVSDYAEVTLYQDSGGNLTVNHSTNYSPEFWMTRVA